MATQINLTTGSGTSSISLSTGARGPTGPAGSDATVTAANVAAVLSGAFITAAVTDSLTLGTHTGNANGAGDVFDTAGTGNFWVQNRKAFGWRKADGTVGPYAYYDQVHDVFGGELIWDIPWRMAIVQNGPLQFGNNAQTADAQCLHITSGGSSASRPIAYSRAVSWQTKRYNGGGTEKVGYVTAQATSLSSTGDDTVLRYAIAENPAGGPVDGFSGGGGTYTKGTSEGTTMAEFSASGIWTPGLAPAFTALSDNGTLVTQTCSKYQSVQSGTITLAGNRSLVLDGMLAGQRGIIYVTQPASGGPYTLAPSGGTALDTSTAANACDRVAWDFDGTFVNFAVTKAVQREVVISDSDVSAFIAAASLTDVTQKSAVNTLVTGLKSASLWTRFYALYPFVGGASAAHAVNLKTPGTYNITWSGSPTHDANGITGNGTSAYGNTGINLTTLGAQNSVSAYAYCKSATPTDGGYFFGATDTPRFGMARSGTNIGYHGPNNLSNSGWSPPTGGDFRAHIAINRSASNARSLYFNAALAGGSEASTGTPNTPIFLLARALAGSVPNGYSNANLAFAAVGTSLSESEWTTFRGLIDAFQTTLGRANP